MYDILTAPGAVADPNIYRSASIPMRSETTEKTRSHTYRSSIIYIHSSHSLVVFQYMPSSQSIYTKCRRYSLLRLLISLYTKCCQYSLLRLVAALQQLVARQGLYIVPYVVSTYINCKPVYQCGAKLRKRAKSHTYRSSIIHIHSSHSLVVFQYMLNSASLSLREERVTDFSVFTLSDTPFQEK
jgi:hypothetical protein